jgi:TolB-like protein
VPLQPQPFKLLKLLLSRPGELVTREEIRGHLWGEETFVDYEQGIAYCVREVRRALGDSARAGRFVETVPGRGFRFLGETRPEPVRGSRRGQRRGFRQGFAVGGVIAFVALTAAVAAIWSAGERPPRLAVLPFESLSGGAEGEMQARGLTEELIAWLGRRLKQRVEVLAPNSIYRLRGEPRTLSETAELLHADYVVEGTVRESQSGVRVSVRLVQPAEALTLWAQEFDATLEDPIALQLRLGHEIGRALGVELLPEEAPRPDPEIQRVLREARAYRRVHTLEALEKARHLLETAVDREPDTAGLWAELGYVRLALGEADQAVEALRRASSLGDPSAELYRVLAVVRLFQDLDIAAADRLVSQALELNPSLAAAHQLRAFLLSALGHHREALTAIARARSLDPLYEDIAADGGWIHYFAHRFEEADAECGESLSLSRQTRWGHLCRVLARTAQGDVAGAWQAARAEMRALGFGKPDDPDVVSLPPGEALRRYWQWRLEWLQSLDPWRMAPTELATCYMGLGDTEAALSALEWAFEVRRGWERLFLAQHPLYEPLHEEPRFERLLVRLAEAQNGSQGSG